MRSGWAYPSASKFGVDSGIPAYPRLVLNHTTKEEQKRKRKEIVLKYFFRNKSFFSSLETKVKGEKKLEPFHHTFQMPPATTHTDGRVIRNSDELLNLELVCGECG